MASTGKSYSIQAVAGNLDYSQARHLLDRCIFGAGQEEVNTLTGRSISSALNTLMQVPALPTPPVSVDARDTDVGLGQTWIGVPHNNTFNAYRLKSLRAWWIGLMMQQGSSLSEKMTLFWHNHFVTEIDTVNIPALFYQYNQLLRKHALGNVKQLATEITVNPAMLIYLNGESNTASAPNENFGRELFELFTIGKGALISDGNYTNYTETDIREAAKVLTGWQVNRTTFSSYYNTSRHDKTTKAFTETFGKTSIQNQEAEEYKTLVDMIFSRKETARYIARKVYRWFMYYQIDQVIEDQIIEPLATILFINNYEIRPMLEQLLASEHFFSSDYFGSQIKNPLDHTIGVYRKCAIALSPNVLTNYEAWSEIHTSCRNMEMDLGNPPDVAGWPQYYKDPAYYELWINSATIPMRTSYTDTLCAAGITKAGFKYVVDPFAMAGKTGDPADVSKLINGMARMLLPVTLSSAQVLQLREILIPGLPEGTWTFEWNKYISTPGDLTQKNMISKKLQALLTAIMRLPEFYLT